VVRPQGNYAKVRNSPHAASTRSSLSWGHTDLEAWTLKLEFPNPQTGPGSFGSVNVGGVDVGNVDVGSVDGKTFSSFPKSGVPRPVTYGAQNQPTSKMKIYRPGGMNGIPSSNGRESISAAALIRTL
jgi:hypothetical protein